MRKRYRQYGIKKKKKSRTVNVTWCTQTSASWPQAVQNCLPLSGTRSQPQGYSFPQALLAAQFLLTTPTSALRALSGPSALGSLLS